MIEVHVGLLEDNPSIQDYIRWTLEMQGYSVSTYDDGSQFLESLTSPQHTLLSYDVVIVDLGLPGNLRGETVIEYLINMPRCQTVGIMVYSGADATTLSQVSSRFPTVIVVQKPVARESLLRLVQEAKTHRASRAV